MYTAERAQQLSVCGWVRNRGDGSVEAVFEGEEANVQAAVEWCRTGPKWASVDDLTVEWARAKGDLTGFAIRPSV